MMVLKNEIEKKIEIWQLIWSRIYIVVRLGFQSLFWVPGMQECAKKKKRKKKRLIEIKSSILVFHAWN